MTPHDAPTHARAAFADFRRRASADPIAQDPHLVAILERAGLGAELPGLRAFAVRCARELDAAAIETNLAENLPRLRRFDGFGNRTEEVVFHPDYHRIGRAVYGTGVMSRYAEPGAQTASLAIMVQLSQLGEAGHACPLACTAGLIRILQRAIARAEDAGDPTGPMPGFLERLLDPDYDTHAHASQFLTEVQGGSDVGANAVIAHPEEGGWWRISGEKWFCSVADAQLFLVTARVDDAPGGTRGLRAFVVPRHDAEGRPNGFRLRRLKDKLGTRSMASAEIDFEGARGWPVGDFRDVVNVVLNTSRLYNAMACCGILQRAWREADAYARTRKAFGRPILDFPSTAAIVARLKCEAYAARTTSFALARLSDRRATGRTDPLDEIGWRALVNLNKTWTATQATTAARDAIEVLGGNGAIESFSVLPRLLRDGIVVEAWEGGHNVLCAQILRDSRRMDLMEGFFAWLERELGGLDAALTEAREEWKRLVQDPDADAFIRDRVEALRRPVAAALLRHEADGRDPMEAVVAEHLAGLDRTGYQAAADPRRRTRIRRLTEPVV